MPFYCAKPCKEIVTWICALFLLVPGVSYGALPRPPHLDLDASSGELFKSLLAEKGVRALNRQISSYSPEFQKVLEAGRRNISWLKYINSFREEPLQFTKPGDLKGYPISKPSAYSEGIIIQKFEKLRGELPSSMKVVLLENGDFTRLPPAPVAEYVEYGRQVDVLYQTALRWITMAPYLEYLKESRRRDIRGYYFLSQQEGLREKLRAYETQTPESRSELKTWLQMNCYISEASDELCEEEVQTTIEKNELVRFLEKYWARAKETYESFFQLQNPRDDVGWHSPLESRVKIRSDLSPDRKDFIKFNLEDGFRWNGWKLIVDFSSDARTRLWWQPGITPHADRLGGDNIYMDSDAPLSEWDTQWTIRHEYGHVLGLPDCYIEFYSVPEQAIVSYQIDVGDLMCSRAGKFNQRLFDELHKHYRNPLVAD